VQTLGDIMRKNGTWFCAPPDGNGGGKIFEIKHTFEYLFNKKCRKPMQWLAA
jgi:hypothetical protein